MDNKAVEDGIEELGCLAIVLVIAIITLITWIILEI
jgi:hypothetical protein